jgi:branched-chain amino acid transport system substrate-binding protein
MQVVYEGAISLTQPDYTAQCLQAQSAGAQAMNVVGDGNTVIRFANSCAQQGYHPLIIDVQPQEVSPSLNGAVAVTQGFPWMVTSGSPALDEYGQALARYDHNQTGGESSLGWDSGKLLQKVLEIALSHSATPTTAGLFQALWSLRNETLGGLTPPLSFYEGKPAPEPNCTFKVTVRNDQWIAPDGPYPKLCYP